MHLRDEDRVRYARQLLLPQIGEAGQARLAETAVVVPSGADPRASEVARSYLARAGVAVAEEPSAGVRLGVPDADELGRIAGTPALREAASALAGALCAVEAICGVVLPGARPAFSIPAIRSEEV